MVALRAGLVCVMAVIGLMAAAQQPASDSPAVTAMIARLRESVGPRWEPTVRFWCETPRANRPDDPVIPPTKIFDNVYAIGNSGTTVYVVQTTAGLLMIDALGAGTADATTAQLETQLLPGFTKLGLNPADVKIVLVTHGHADHYGGSRYFQERFGAKVYVSAADWDVMLAPPAPGRGGGQTAAPTPLPKRDGDIVDGTPIALGDVTVTPVAVPGHTPGSMGFIFPVRDRGAAHVAALFGGAWLTPQILSDACARDVSAVGRPVQGRDRARPRRCPPAEPHVDGSYSAEARCAGEAGDGRGQSVRGRRHLSTRSSWTSWRAVRV